MLNLCSPLFVFGLAAAGRLGYNARKQRKSMPEEQQPEKIAEFTTVESVFVRGRNCLLLRADMSPLFVDYYLHLMQHGLRNEATEDAVLKDVLAYFTLHLVSRPWAEYHAWTFNTKVPSLANYFVSGSSTDEEVVGRAFTDNVREPEKNMLFAQILARGKEPQTSVITLPEGKVCEWVEAYYRQSEQRMARAFELGDDRYALITAQPGADHDWLESLTAEDIAAIDSTENTKVLETRKFFFRCGCTVEKILPVLRAMHKDFADQLSEQGYIEVSCPRCGATYRVTPDMVKEST